MRKIYQERYTLLRESAQQHLAEYLEIATIEAGMQTIGRLRASLVNQGITAEMVAQRAALVDIDIVPLSRYCHAATIPEALQIGFAAVHEKEIPRGVLKLASIFDRIKAERLPPPPSVFSRNLH
jgi:DNA-binding transcriptional MocR family regulator